MKFISFEDVLLVEFMYPVLTCMQGGVTAGNSGLCCCVPCLSNTITSLYCVVDWAQSTNWLTKIPLVILINRKGDLHSTWRDISTRMIALSGKQSGWRFVNYAVIITNPVGGNHIQQDLLQMVIHSHFDIWFLSNTYSQAFYSQCRKHTHTHTHKYSTDPCLKKKIKIKINRSRSNAIRKYHKGKSYSSCFKFWHS